MEDGASAVVKDLLIIGGGPAGTSAALEACRQGLAVAIWERDRFPRHKVCGEFISAESLAALEEEINFEAHHPAVIRRSEFISPRGKVHGFALPSPARGISRRLLDQALWRAAAGRGAELHEGEGVRSVRRVARPGGLSKLWEIRSANGHRQQSRALTICAGRWWSLEGIPGPARSNGARGGEWLGAKAHFAEISPRDAVEMYYFPGGYCGLAPIENGLYNACCLVHQSLAQDASAPEIGDFSSWISWISGHRVLAERLRAGAQVSKTVTTAPVEPARRCSDFQGALMAGDAAGFLDPFTGDGISIALQSGRLAARCLAPGLAGKCDREAAARAAQVYGRKLGEAVGPSYRLAGILRTLVRAPRWLQESVAASLPWLGPRFEAGTRWRNNESRSEAPTAASAEAIEMGTD
jgi:flavin-dependent dehydrogenase